MIQRNLRPHLLKDAKETPIIAILGPRQSGKTTLARMTFPDYTYISFEDLDYRSFATQDPRRFLEFYGANSQRAGIIFDEIQHVPALLSYLQTHVDLYRTPGFFILTGSQNFLIHEAITQTLAGRMSLHTLLPLSIDELERANERPATSEETMFKGFYPSIYAYKSNPTEWYNDYYKLYLERDVRTITNVTDLTTFQTFIKMCAARIGQAVNLTSLGADCGISYNTAKAWLSVLEASYIVFMLRPYYNNFNKQLIKTPKLYFYDTGLACVLLGIESPERLHLHSMRGPLFECMVIAELHKKFYNADRIPHLYFWSNKRTEVDCIIERGEDLFPIEIKAGNTIVPAFFDQIKAWNEAAGNDPSKSSIVYAGNEYQPRSLANVVPWHQMERLPGLTEQL